MQHACPPRQALAGAGSFRGADRPTSRLRRSPTLPEHIAHKNMPNTTTLHSAPNAGHCAAQRRTCGAAAALGGALGVNWHRVARVSEVRAGDAGPVVVDGARSAQAWGRQTEVYGLERGPVQRAQAGGQLKEAWPIARPCNPTLTPAPAPAPCSNTKHIQPQPHKADPQVELPFVAV